MPDLGRFAAFARRVGATPACNTCNTSTHEGVLRENKRNISDVTCVTPVTPEKSREAQEDALLELYEERAAIMEYDGGLPRQEAEASAWREVFGERPRPGNSPKF